MLNRTSPVYLLVIIVLAASPVVAGELVEFEAHRIGSFRSEACCVADFTGDGRLDIAAGPFVYVAPDWRPWKIRELKGDVDEQGNGAGLNIPVVDLDTDGDLDIVVTGKFGGPVWFENKAKSSAQDE